MRSGGSMYWGASLEAQTPLYFLPKDVGIKVAAFADAGSLVGLPRADQLERDRRNAPGRPRQRVKIRSSVGVGLLWDSPLGPLRFDFAYPMTKYCATGSDGARKCATARSFSASAAAPSSDLGCVRRHGDQDPARMSEPVFLRHSRGLTLEEIVALTGATFASASYLSRGGSVNIAPLDRAAPHDLAFFDNRSFAAAAANTTPAMLSHEAALASELPTNGVAVLTVREPYRAFVTVARALFPQALRPSSLSEPGELSGRPRRPARAHRRGCQSIRVR